jgi:hypothetical protein
MGGADFTAIDRRLTLVLDSLSDELSAAERREVEEFIDVGEYGVALETLSALLVEERKRISPVTFAEIVELADLMGIREATITDGLRRRVIPK